MADPVVSKTLRLTFSTSMGKSFSITLKNPKSDITAAQATAVIDTIIAKDIFFTSSGALVAKKDVKVLDNTTTDLYDVPVV